MKRILLVALAFLVISAGNISAKEQKGDETPDPTEVEDEMGPSNPTILKFRTMVGVAPPYTGTANPIRGISGGGLPWVLSDGKGMLRADGTLRVKVRGLVIPVAPFNGTNPAPNFRATVSCMSVDDTGAPIIANVQTGLFPANTLGDSDIKEKLDLPKPCIAPIIFVTSPTGSWFSATGF